MTMIRTNIRWLDDFSKNLNSTHKRRAWGECGEGGPIGHGYRVTTTDEFKMEKIIPYIMYNNARELTVV